MELSALLITLSSLCQCWSSHAGVSQNFVRLTKTEHDGIASME